MKLQVTVERTSYCTGVVKVEAKNHEQAQKKVSKLIRSGKIQPDDIVWDYPVNDNEMIVTGDVD